VVEPLLTIADHQRELREVTFEVVRNDRDQYSVWPRDRALPDGWRRCGFGGGRSTCLDHIERTWQSPVLLDREAASGRMSTRSTPHFPRLFRAAGDAWPDQVALTDGVDSVTYRELRSLVDRQALALVEEGVGPGDVVAILPARSFETVTALLAVMQIGASYLPLDPDWPSRRTASVLAVSDPALVLVDPSRDVAPVAWLAPAISCLTAADGPAPAAWTEPAPTDDVDPAYVMFTSGSTGTPKGVVVGHGALAGFIAWSRGYFELGRGCRVLQFSRLTFDASVWEIFGALGTGATLCLVGEETALDPRALSAVIARLEITHFDIVPSVVALLDPAECTSLRHCMCGGEALSTELVAEWANPGRIVVNGYGPAEATVVSVAARFDGEPDGQVPIGWSIDGIEAYVLDDRLDPVEPGAVGELCLAGPNLANGYLQAPRETAERFIPNPFSAVPGDRLYRTGDLVSLLDSGEYAFRGRVDGQVKIAGQRVEPGDIEAVLRRADGVRDCAVVPFKDGERPRLAAFVCGAAVDVEGLGAHCAASLPAYMVPHRFVGLESLPLTRSNKVDRDELSARATADRRGAEAQVEAGEDDLLARAVAEILDVRFDPDRSLLELGGDSLDAMRLAARLAAAFPGLAATEILEAESLGRLRDGLREGAPVAAAILPPLPPAPEGAWPLSFGQQDLYLAQLVAPSSAYNVAISLEFEAKLDRGALALAIGWLCERHQMLRRGVGFAAGGSLQSVVVEPPALTVEATGSDGDLAEATARFASEPFDLSIGPPSRFRLLELADGRDVLLVVAHHVAMDGDSARLIVGELGDLYDRALAGAGPPPPLEVTYGRYAVWERRLAGEPMFGDALDEWAAELADLPAGLALAGRMDGAFAARGRIPVSLDGETVDRVVRMGQDEHASVYMVLLAAFSKALVEVTERSDFVIGCPIGTRFDPRLEANVGHFVNVLPLRIDVGPADPVREAVGKVRRRSLAAYRRWFVPFGQIVSRLGIPPEDRLRPLARMAFRLDPHLAPAAFGAQTPKVLPLTPDGIPMDVLGWLEEDDGGIAGGLDFDSGIYSVAAVGELTAAFDATLRALG
jgi:amino acid adenylation domain-containing protein